MNDDEIINLFLKKLVEVLISIRIKAELFQQQSFIIGKPVNFLYRM